MTRTAGVYSHQHGSAISLTPSDVEEPHHVYTIVVETVVSVARNCKDAKITALALILYLHPARPCHYAVMHHHKIIYAL